MTMSLGSAIPENFVIAGDSRLAAQVLWVVASWMCLWIWGKITYVYSLPIRQSCILILLRFNGLSL